jgi:hypothetical protein
MPFHIRFIDDGLPALVDAVRSYVAQRKKELSKRDPRVIAQAISSAEIALQKAAKHTLARLDPYLLFASPKADLIQNLHREIAAKNLPGLFSAVSRLDTHGTKEAWRILLDVKDPKIDPETQAGFNASLANLIEARNLYVHGELFGETDHYLGVLEYVLSSSLTVLPLACTNFWKRLKRQSPATITSLRAIERRVDAGWLALLDHLHRRGRIDVDLAIITRTFSDADHIELTISEHSSKSSSYLLAMGPVSLVDATGLFRVALSRDEVEARDNSRVGPPHTTTTALFPSRPRSRLAEAAFPSDARRELDNAIVQSFQRNRDRQKAHAERYGLKAIDAGVLRLRALAGFAQLRLKPKSKLLDGAEILIRDLTVSVPGNRAKGKINGTIETRPSGFLAQTPALKIVGRVWMTSEFVIDHVTNTPASTVRFFRARARITEAGPSPGPDGA